MAIDPSLQPGIDSWKRRDYVGAREAWETLAEAARGPERDQALLLVRLAGALAEAEAGRAEAAEGLWDQTPGAFDGLPDRLLGLDLARLRADLPATVGEAVSSPPRLRPVRRVPTAALLRFAVLVVIVGAALAAFRWGPLGEWLDRERLIGALEALRSRPWAPAALVLLYAVACPLGLPATPLVFAGAAVFGLMPGGLYNVAGSVGGAVVSFLLARMLGHELVAHVAGEERLSRIEKMLARHGFWTLVQIRFVPVPFPIVNFGAALAGVPLRMFVLSSILGLTPAVLIYSWFAEILLNATAGITREIVFKLALSLLLSFSVATMPTWIRGWRRRRRYRRLLEARRRGAGTGRH